MKNKYTIKNVEIRAVDDEEKGMTIEGILPYNSKSVPMGGIIEVITKTAFNKSLKDGKEIRALWNHNDSFLLGSTKSETLQLVNGEDGLHCTCKIPNTSYGKDLFELVKRGDVKSMSFGFIPVKTTVEKNMRYLNEVNLLEVSFGVYNPAYPSTDSIAYTRNFDMNLKTIIQETELEENEIIELIELLNSKLPPATEEQPPKNTELEQRALEELENLKTMIQLELSFSV